MALKGTLKDFGIADIFQLIGHQTKTGVLHLTAKDEEVHIAFSNGSIVRADTSSRRRRDLLGTMLLNAGILSQKQLDQALETQRRTLQRLGDILVEKRFISTEQLKEMYQLQVSETIYRLFGWKSGNYEFEQGAVEFDPAIVAPIHSESVLMEGFRRVDEWPTIRKIVSSTAMTFVRLTSLPAGLSGAAGPDADAELDAALGIAGGKGHGEFASLGRNERRVFRLAEPGRTVQQIIDLARLGEFEGCKALLNLVNTGKLQPVQPESKEKGQLGLGAKSLKERAVAIVTRLGMTAVVVAVVSGLSYLLNVQDVATGDRDRAFADRTAQHLLAGTELRRIDAALAVFRLEKGAFPERLEELAHAGLIRPKDLQYPYGAAYFYRRIGEASYVLLPPIE
ncbi:MAG: DUF4388 domain-containing protein [Myxococcales bacterium]